MHGWRELWWRWRGRRLVWGRRGVHRVHELLPVGTICRDFDLISDPGVRPFRSKTVDVAGSEMSPGADPMPRVGSVLICRSWTEHVFGRPVIVPLQAEDPPHHRAIRRARGDNESRGINAGSRLRPHTDCLEFAVRVGPVGDDRLDST